MSVGKELQDARIGQGWDLYDIAASLRIQPNYLEAIEAEDFRELPGGAYTIGFVKTYARALGLDQEKIGRTFRQEQADALQIAPLRIRSPIVESRVPTASIAILALIIAVVAWIAWAYLAPGDRKMAETVPAVPDRLAPPAPIVVQAPDAAAPAFAPAPATVAPTPQSSLASSSPNIPAAMPFTGNGDMDEAENDTDQPAQSSGVRTAPANQDNGTGSVLGTSASALPSRVEIRTSEDSWIQIRDGAHNPIFTGVMHPGDVYKLPNTPGYTFTTGNAGAISLVVDGVAGKALGIEGQVLKNVEVPYGQIAKKP